MIEVTPYGNLNTTWFNTALKILVTLASDEDYHSSTAICEQVNKDASFIRKVMTPLLKKNFVLQKMGRNGGYKLNQSPAEISLFAIYEALVEDANITPIPPQNHFERVLGQILTETEEAFTKVLKQHYLQELLAESK